MKGVAIILILLGLLVTGYLVMEDMKARKEQGTGTIEAVEKADQTAKKVQKSYDAQEKRLKGLVGE